MTTGVKEYENKAKEKGKEESERKRIKKNKLRKKKRKNQAKDQNHLSKRTPINFIASSYILVSRAIYRRPTV